MNKRKRPTTRQNYAMGVLCELHEANLVPFGMHKSVKRIVENNYYSLTTKAMRALGYEWRGGRYLTSNEFDVRTARRLGFYDY